MKPAIICAAITVVATSVVPAFASDAVPRLHSIKAVCIDYEISGQMINGKTKRCHRKYGYEQYEIQKMKVGFGGFTQTQNQHNITIGDTIYAIDLAKNSGTKTKNPMYDGLVSSMKDKSPEEMANAFIAAMGFTQTGTTKTIAKLNCNVYNSAQMGSMCFTENGLMLEQSIMGNKTIATSVSIGAGGGDANYTLYKNVPITDGPDLSKMPNLQELLEEARQ